jgi:hypothetical protein
MAVKKHRGMVGGVRVQQPSKPDLGWPKHPLIYEINTWPWLASLGEAAETPVPLADVPDAEWDRIAKLGYDAVWLMGVWGRSPAGIGVALNNAELMRGFREALPDFDPSDVVGSPYCVRRYEVDARLGGRSGLAVARQALRERGIRLVLDFVPNHVAPDHPWTTQHPEFFIEGDAGDRERQPEAFHEIGGRFIACGRDPYFPPWPDVVQLNAFSPALRRAVITTLLDIAAQCDGVRCDMAMLVMNEIFQRTWGQRAGAAPALDYWPQVIPEVRSEHPNFVFIAEAYWDMEWQLQQQGFDYCYDKRLYDRLVHESAESVRLHLTADLTYQDRLLRFIENHDEPRAASVFPRDQHEAAAVATLTQTGLRLVHDGQTIGRQVHLPVFLGRLPSEEPDTGLEAFYRSLLEALQDDTLRSGDWRLCDRSGWDGNDTWQQLVAWSWDGAHRWLIVVNLGSSPAAGLVAAPWDDVGERDWRLVDPTTGVKYLRRGDDIQNGLYIGLDPWRWHCFRLEPVTAAEAPTEETTT